MNIVVFCGGSDMDDGPYVQVAFELGQRIAQAGHTLVYGGCKAGLMGAVANGALSWDGEVRGILVDAPRVLARRHQGLSSYENTSNLGQRKNRMMELGDAFVALPGGLGTLDELSDVLSAVRLGMMDAPLVLVNTLGYYDTLQDFFLKMLDEGFCDAQNLERVLVSDDLSEVMAFTESSQKDSSQRG